MRIAVMGDIHGNDAALEKCIKEALWRGAYAFIFLGDYVADMPKPRRVMERLYSLKEKYPCWFIKGNKEDYWIDYRKSAGETQWNDFCSTSGMLYYTYNNLNNEDIDFFETLPISRKLDFVGAPSITICHGSPRKSNEELVRDMDNTKEVMESCDTDLILCAHTHRQWKYEWAGKTLINPGSVGMPLGSKGKAQFAIIDNVSGKWNTEFVSVSYDVEKVINEIDEAGLPAHAPYWIMLTKRTLRDGNPYHMKALRIAMSLCKREQGECTWPRIPEKCWEAAIKEV